MVVHAVNNEVLCGSGSQMAGFGCDDMAAVDRQLKAARDLEAFIDQQSGGPGTGWFRIVTSGEHARQVINSGKMAAVLGIEVDTLFGCRPNGICTEAQLLGQLDKYYNLGVRHVFPVHFFNNGIGSPAVYEQALSVGNRVLNGAFYQTEDCSATYGFNLNAAETALAGLLRSLFGVPTNVFEGRGHCNAGGLTPIGEALIRGLIRKKMILDVDHMSAKMLGHVLDIVEAERYPVVSGHSEFLDISVGQRRAERVLTSAFANRIRDLGWGCSLPSSRKDHRRYHRVRQHSGERLQRLVEELGSGVSVRRGQDEVRAVSARGRHRQRPEWRHREHQPTLRERRLLQQAR